ncbi:unnamed protein product [Ceratitis capitata]|uniref:(Mediterranean fruit fly) hypothetical protein n=1 Tax=Ceratitis capitata TaxID=7213 RepID=A0A811UWA6_CERCA|nr:unnamed protein product [Ceratitis capitata]
MVHKLNPHSHSFIHHSLAVKRSFNGLSAPIIFFLLHNPDLELVKYQIIRISESEKPNWDYFKND